MKYVYKDWASSAADAFAVGSMGDIIASASRSTEDDVECLIRECKAEQVGPLS